MRRQRTIRNFTQYTDLSLLSIALLIVQSMLDNAGYPNPVPTIEALKDLTASFEEGLTASRTGLHEAVARKNSLREQLEAMLSAISDYAERISGNDLPLKVSSGFPLTKAQVAPRRELKVPGYFRATDGSGRGCMHLEQERQSARKAYLWRIAEGPAPQGEWSWRTCITFDPECEIDALESGKSYSVQAAAWNGEGPTMWSEIVTRIVQ